MDLNAQIQNRLDVISGELLVYDLILQGKASNVRNYTGEQLRIKIFNLQLEFICLGTGILPNYFR